MLTRCHEDAAQLCAPGKATRQVQSEVVASKMTRMLQSTDNATADTDTAQIARGPPIPRCYGIQTSDVSQYIDTMRHDFRIIYHHIANDMIHYRLMKSKLQYPTACCPMSTMLLRRCRVTVLVHDDVRSHENMATDSMPQKYPTFTHCIALPMSQDRGRQSIHQLHLCRHHTADMAQSHHIETVVSHPVRNKRISTTRHVRSSYAHALRSARLTISSHDLQAPLGGPAYVSYRRSASILTGRRGTLSPRPLQRFVRNRVYAIRCSRRNK